jgi:antitoxin ParD1/3/4
MPTVTINISLNDELKSFVDSHVKADGYKSPGEYVCELLQRQVEQERFEALIQAGLDSPIDTRTWEEHKASLTRRIEAARPPQSRNAA